MTTYAQVSHLSKTRRASHDDLADSYPMELYPAADAVVLATLPDTVKFLSVHSSKDIFLAVASSLVGATAVGTTGVYGRAFVAANERRVISWPATTAVCVKNAVGGEVPSVRLEGWK